MFGYLAVHVWLLCRARLNNTALPFDCRYTVGILIFDIERKDFNPAACVPCYLQCAPARRATTARQEGGNSVTIVRHQYDNSAKAMQ